MNLSEKRDRGTGGGRARRCILLLALKRDGDIFVDVFVAIVVVVVAETDNFSSYFDCNHLRNMNQGSSVCSNTYHRCDFTTTFPQKIILRFSLAQIRRVTKNFFFNFTGIKMSCYLLSVAIRRDRIFLDLVQDQDCFR